jgi:2-polyprenyl-6-methoxyphenol hydroxylase-like FAD-dependent oxidoreductase
MSYPVRQEGTRRMSMSRTDVCVVGGGPAGLLLGLLLARRGVDITVLEGHETFDREFRGEVLQPSTARLLDEVGLLGYVLGQPHVALTNGRIRVGGRPAGEFDFRRISPDYPYALWMPQPIFLSALVRKAEPFRSFHCWMGARVTELCEEGRSVVGVRGTRHGQEAFEVRADVVVGADGRHSVVRRLGGFELEYDHHDGDVIWFVFAPPPGWPNTISFSIGGATPYLLLPKYPNQVQAGLLLPTDAWKRWRQDGVAAVAERIRRLDPVFAEFAGNLRDFTPFFPLQATRALARRWARDGLLLIGDAAHTMSPAGAIGVNVALATAAVAAQEIYPRLGRGPIPLSALARVQKLREGDVRTLHRLQGRAGAAVLGSGARIALLRRLLLVALPVLLRSPLLPRLQRRLFLGAPLPPLDPAFSFRETPSPPKGETVGGEATWS